MNPFDLPGPQFLGLYAFFGLAVVLLLYRAKRSAEAGEPGRLPVSDPYLIAYLRGGAQETLRLSLTVLIDRQLLDVDGEQLETRKGVSPNHGANALERAILERCKRGEPARDVLDNPALQELARQTHEPGLLRLGLIAGPDVRARRRQQVVAAIVVLVVVAAIKVAIGLSRNRPVSLLIVSAILFAVAAVVVMKGVRTVRGDRILEDLKVLFDDLRRRASQLRPNASTSELALLVAVFGLDPLPVLSYPFVQAFRPKPAPSSCGSGIADGGSSSSGCGGGGDGGGGGCGGGGCGGCGSS